MSKKDKQSKEVTDPAYGTVMMIVPDVGPTIEGTLIDQDAEQITLRVKHMENKKLYDVVIEQKHIVQTWIEAQEEGDGE